MVDGPECGIPDFGPYAVRWNMAALWEAVNEQRMQRGESWDDIRRATLCRDVEGIRFVYFDDRDVVRHHLVSAIVRAYDAWSARPPAEGPAGGGAGA